MAASLLQKHRWLIYLLPFAVFMAVNLLEPTPQTPGGHYLGLAIPYAWYPAVYTAKIVLTLLAVAWVFPSYRQFPFRVTPLGALVGVVGAVLWIALCKVEPRLWEAIGLKSWAGQGARSAFNPLAELAANPMWAWGFLLIRFFGLVLLVPLIEEFFLRGWAMRFFSAEEWWELPIGKVNALAIAVGTLFPMFTHPLSEVLAVAVWFSMVTWLMVRTRNIWDCILAHATTNLLLGVYVVVTGHWELM